MNDFDYLWEGGPRMKQSPHFKLGTDSVLLGNFADISGAVRGVDLGCCTGVLSLLLLCRSEKLHMTGIEIDGAAAEIATENMAVNSLEQRSQIITGDLRNYKEYLPSGAFDIVISNPPYFSLGSGIVSPDVRKAKARGEVSCTLEDIVSAAAYLCRWDGKVYFVYKPERLCELMTCMSSHGIEPKRMRLVSHSDGYAPSLVLMEGRRGGRTGLKVEPTLHIVNPDGSDTEEIKKIYHRD